MGANEQLPHNELEKIIEESSRIQANLTRLKKSIGTTSEQVVTENERLEEILKEIPVLIQNLPQEGTDYARYEEMISLLEASIKSKTDEKGMILDAIEKLQTIELPQQEVKLKGIKEQIKSVQPELRQRLNNLDKITREITSENEELNKLLKQVQLFENSLAEYKSVYQEMLEEIKATDNRLIVKTEEKGKILDTIKELESDEIPRQEVKLREIESQIELTQPDLTQRQSDLDKISQEITVADKKHQELLMEIQTLTQRQKEMSSIYDGLPKEIASLDIILVTRTQEKQRISNEIKNLESVELPQQESNLNEIREQIRQIQSEINKKREPLDKMTQEIPQLLQKLKELEKKEDMLKKEYHAADEKRQELAKNLDNLEEVIDKKRIERDKLSQWTTQVVAGVNQYSELIDKTKGSTRLLMDELHRRREIYGNSIPTASINVSGNYIPELKALKRDAKPTASADLWKTIFFVCVTFLVLSVIAFFVWQIIKLKLI